jgi:hypothetical protein
MRCSPSKPRWRAAGSHSALALPIGAADNRLRVKGETDEDPAAHEAGMEPPPVADEPIDALTAANRTKIEALRRERVPAGPVDLVEPLRCTDGAWATALLLATLAMVIVGAAARAGMIPGSAGLLAFPGAVVLCPCGWQSIAVPLTGLGLATARWSRRVAREVGNLTDGGRLGRPHRAATALGTLATTAGVVLALSAAWFAVPVDWI